jgi:hypothetical protein
MTKMSSESPVLLLKDTSIKVGQKKWVPLDNRVAINDYVKDVLGIMNGHEVIDSVLALITEYNFGFLSTWKPIHIPARLCAPIGDKEKVTFEDDPVMAQLIANQIATMKELEEYYSLQDAFRMYDILISDNLNKALSAEASHKEAVENSKRKK